MFQLFALNQQLALPPTFTLDETTAAMQGRVIALARLDGTYEVP